MTTTIYKGYTVQTIGISRYIYRPGQDLVKDAPGTGRSAGYAMSMAEAKRWINTDLQTLSQTLSAVEFAGIDPKEREIWRMEHCQ